MRSRALAVAPFLAALGGCATVAPLRPPVPEVPLAAWEGGAAESAAPGNGSRRAPPPALAKTAERRTSDAPSGAGRAPRATTAPSPIPGGATCLRELERLDVPFRSSEPVLGIATPIVLAGSLDGIRFFAADHRPFLADCRLVLALRKVTPDLRALGVSAVRFSGAYVYKLTHPGRMSMHAFGLAADLHAFEIHGALLEVKRDFEHGLGCRDGMPVLNQVACRIRAHGVFKEQLGPDDNAAHFDHFHVGLKPLPGELADDLPLPAQARPVKRATRVNATRRSVSARSAR